jgi:hypothetical protein
LFFDVVALVKFINICKMNLLRRLGRTQNAINIWFLSAMAVDWAQALELEVAWVAAVMLTTMPPQTQAPRYTTILVRTLSLRRCTVPMEAAVAVAVEAVQVPPNNKRLAQSSCSASF